MLIDSQIVEVQKQIILKLKDLINYKNFEPGDKLPSERMLADKFGVTRSNLREALQKLEFYGLVKSIPQSGTFVADIGITAMNGMIDDILGLSIPDDLIHLENTLADYSAKVIKGEDAVQEDLLFHLAIAKSSANPTINTFMLKITPEIITNFEKHHVCDKDTAFKGIEEHKAIIDAIRNQDPDQAKTEMKKHFKDLYQYCYNI